MLSKLYYNLLEPCHGALKIYLYRLYKALKKLRIEKKLLKTKPNTEKSS